AADDNKLTPGELVIRRANCGAANATNPIGPAAAVTSAVVATPTTINTRRAALTLKPCVSAVSSPISMWCKDLANTKASPKIATDIATLGVSEPHVTRLMEPALQKPTIIASSTSARVI